jgi:hypothetical protein
MRRSLPFGISAIATSLALAIACSTDPNTGGTALVDGSSPNNEGGSSTTPDGSSSGGDDDSGQPKPDDGGSSDASCVGPIVTTSGETCIGFGPTDTCDPSCGQPFGYICFNGAPPGFTGCREQRVSASLGNTYCCPKNDCVAMPDRDQECASTAGKPHRFQCPPNDNPSDGGPPTSFATPPGGCVEKGSGATELERFYCCP